MVATLYILTLVKVTPDQNDNQCIHAAYLFFFHGKTRTHLISDKVAIYQGNFNYTLYEN